MAIERLVEGRQIHGSFPWSRPSTCILTIRLVDTSHAVEFPINQATIRHGAISREGNHMHTTINEYMKRRFDTTRDESPFMDDLIMKATGSIEGYPDRVSNKDIDRALQTTMKRKMKTISPTINEIVWMNRHLHDIIDIPPSSITIMRINNLWTYLAGAVERRRHHQYTPINNDFLMRTTGWCH